MKLFSNFGFERERKEVKTIDKNYRPEK